MGSASKKSPARPRAVSRAPSRKRAPPPKAKSAPSRAPAKSARTAKGSASKAAPAKAAAAGSSEPVTPTVPRPDARRHVLSLAFLRDGDEFLARLETDGGEITELKNRALDQLLMLVAGELEDLL
jgi:hypothetical protein